MRNHLPHSIGVICHFPPPAGGMQVQAEALVAGLQSEGIDAIRIRTNIGSSSLALWLDGLRMVRTFIRIPLFLVRLARALPRIEAVHINACSGIAFFAFAAPAILLGRLFGKAVILHYHSGSGPEFFRATAPVTPWIFRRATSVVVPSRYLREAFESWGVSAHMVANICDLRRFQPPEPPPHPVFIVARNLEPIYNNETAIRAFAEFYRKSPNARLVIAGDGPEAAMLRELARSLNVSSAVEFTGSVDNSRIPDLMRRVTAVVNTSLTDNQPVSVIEGFAAGVPVISSNVGGVPDLITDGVNGLLFEARDASGLARQMKYVADHPEEARRLAACARETVEQFSWPSVFRQLRPVYLQQSPASVLQRAV